ncbi:MAG: cell envelope biogenesis protein TolA [Methylobacteriaceae bacterium]|nr:cell envelope biogenesis protein TolA [Methylobacteriaceae bacterium]
MDGERASRFDWGLAVSAGTHGALLLATLIAFADTRRFDEAQEALPVEVVTAAELNQIMRGEKTARPAETPRSRAEQQAERVEQKPETPTPQATRDVPVPPPPLRREPDPGEAAERAPPAPTPPPAPPRLAATPPPRPEPEKPAEAKPEPDKAEPVPQPPRRPEPPRAEPKPTPPARPKPPEQKPPEPKAAEAPPRPKDDRPRLDQVARLLEEKKREEQKAAARPRAGEEEQPPSKYDPASIRKMLSRETPQQSAATGREVSRTASLGTATANAPRMSPSLWGQLDGLLQEQYRECWNKLGFDGQSYVPQIRVTYNADGSLASQPVLVNPPGEPALRALADSAMRAVQKCNPLKIPPQFAPYHAQWRARTLRFDPEEM